MTCYNIYQVILKNPTLSFIAWIAKFSSFYINTINLIMKLTKIEYSKSLIWINYHFLNFIPILHVHKLIHYYDNLLDMHWRQMKLTQNVFNAIMYLHYWWLAMSSWIRSTERYLEINIPDMICIIYNNYQDYFNKIHFIKRKIWWWKFKVMKLFWRFYW